MERVREMSQSSTSRDEGALLSLRAEGPRRRIDHMYMCCCAVNFIRILSCLNVFFLSAKVVR